MSNDFMVRKFNHLKSSFKTKSNKKGYKQMILFIDRKKLCFLLFFAK